MTEEEKNNFKTCICNDEFEYFDKVLRDVCAENEGLSSALSDENKKKHDFTDLDFLKSVSPSQIIERNSDFIVLRVDFYLSFYIEIAINFKNSGSNRLKIKGSNHISYTYYISDNFTKELLKPENQEKIRNKMEIFPKYSKLLDIYSAGVNAIFNKHCKFKNLRLRVSKSEKLLKKALLNDCFIFSLVDASDLSSGYTRSSGFKYAIPYENFAQFCQTLAENINVDFEVFRTRNYKKMEEASPRWKDIFDCFRNADFVICSEENSSRSRYTVALKRNGKRDFDILYADGTSSLMAYIGGGGRLDQVLEGLIKDVRIPYIRNSSLARNLEIYYEADEKHPERFQDLLEQKYREYVATITEIPF